LNSEPTLAPSWSAGAGSAGLEGVVGFAECVAGLVDCLAEWPLVTSSLTPIAAASTATPTAVLLIAATAMR
jgi:hypothetical protein